MYRNPVLLYKTLVVGVIVLFIGLGVQPTIASDVYINKETKDNTDKSVTSNDYQEIITFIIGNGKINWINLKGILRGEVETDKEIITVLSLRGLRLSDSGVEKYNITEVGYVYAPRFIGFSVISPLLNNGIYATIGLAFGNIEWE